MLLAAEGIEFSSVSDLAEEQIKQCVDGLRKLNVNLEHPALIDLEVRNISTKMHIFEVKDRIWTLRRKYFGKLHTDGYADTL